MIKRCIDNLSVVLLGKADNTTGSPPSLYPHQNTLPAGLQYSGKEAANYNMLNTDRLLDSTQADGSGVICHEFLHTLGYPDLYTRDGFGPGGSLGYHGPFLPVSELAAGLSARAFHRLDPASRTDQLDPECFHLRPRRSRQPGLCDPLAAQSL